MPPPRPLKPTPPSPGSPMQAGHGTAKAASRSGPLHPHALVVSIHDVSPRTRSTCDAILNDLESLGVAQCSLLVVPNFHGEGHFLEDPDFCAWLLERAQAGHEIVIHGYFHQRARREDENLATQFTTRVYTADEGEFYDIDHAQALELVRQARAEFQEMGLAPEGFIAPAWLMSAETEDALREAGCEYTTRLGGIVDLRTGTEHRSPSLVWSVRSTWRRVTSLLWNAMLFRSLRQRPLLRISIHPVDVAHQQVWRQIRHLVGEALRDRAPFTYERWVTRERTFRVFSR